MARELRKTLAIVGMTGAVFTGGIFALGGLASASASGDADQTAPPPVAPGAEVGATIGGGIVIEAGEASDFDGFSTEDQAIIKKFEDCIGPVEAKFAEDEDSRTDADFEQLETAFDECEEILDKLSFTPMEWLEGDEDWEDLPELSEADEAVFDEFETCIADVEDQLPEDEAHWTDESFDQLDSQFEECEAILENLSEDGGFFIRGFEDCEHGHELDGEGFHGGVDELEEGDYENDGAEGVVNSTLVDT